MSSLSPYPQSKSQPCWLLRYTDPVSHKQKKEYLHLPEKEAKRIHELKESELIRIKYGLDQSERIYKISKLRELYLEWIMYNRHHNTYKRNKIALNNFINLIGDVARLKSYHIEQFKTDNRHRSPIGVNSDLRCVRAMMNWAAKMEYISHVPYFPLYSEARKEIRVLSNDELTIILQCAEIDPETLLLIELYLLTGARARELLQKAFTWEDFDRKNRLIVLGSNNKQHRVELSDRAMEILLSWKNRSAPIPHTYTYIKKRMNKASNLSGIHFTAHDLRRAAGAVLLRSGASIYEVSKFLRHSSVKVTAIWYIDLLKDDYVNLSNSLEKAINGLKNT